MDGKKNIIPILTKLGVRVNITLFYPQKLLHPETNGKKPLLYDTKKLLLYPLKLLFRPLKLFFNPQKLLLYPLKLLIRMRKPASKATFHVPKTR